MNFGLVLTTNINNEQSLDGVRSLSDRLEQYFAGKNYGDAVQAYVVGVLVMKHFAYPGFEERYQPGKPKYIKKKTVSPDGIPTTIEKAFEYGIKIADAARFETISSEEVSQIMAKELLASLPVLDTMKKKLGDFNAAAFKKDLAHFLIENGYLK